MNKHRSKEEDTSRSQNARALTEEELKRLEEDPQFRRMMKEADDAEREGRWIAHEEVLRRAGKEPARHR
jgi:uncharacterized protein YdeI (YjbR/CyaY-like superfamily)